MKHRISLSRNKEVLSTSKLKKQLFANGARKSCSLCINAYNLEVDHIYPVYLGGSSTVDNCQILCWHCHQKKTLIDKKIIRILRAAGFIERFTIRENVAYISPERLRWYYEILLADIKQVENLKEDG